MRIAGEEQIIYTIQVHRGREEKIGSEEPEPKVLTTCDVAGHFP